MIDTAPAYGFGRAEEIVGKAVAGDGLRNRVAIATKAGLDWHGDQPFRNASKKRIFSEVEASLRRLRTNVIDIYQVHWPDPETPIEETADAMLALLKGGLIRAIAVSTFSPVEMDRFLAIAPIHTVQPPYNLFERAIEHDVLPYADRHAVAALVYGPICRGLLSGRMKPDTTFDKSDLRSVDPKFQATRYARYLRAVRELDRFARDNFGKRVIQLALRWALDQPGVTAALWGARHPAQLDPIEEVMGWALSFDAMREIDRIVCAHVKDPVGPEFMAPPARHQLEAA